MAPRDRTRRQRLDTDTRREAILTAAAAAFAEASYAQVSVAKIAEAAGASSALVFHYFGSKAGLYQALVEDALDTLTTQMAQANAALPPTVPTRDRVRAGLLTYLDYIAEHPHAWAWPYTSSGEPPNALGARRAAAQHYEQRLGELLHVGQWPRHRYALAGFIGFVEHSCLAWVQAGCPPEQRHALAEAALGALEGALGDWGS